VSVSKQCIATMNCYVAKALITSTVSDHSMQPWMAIEVCNLLSTNIDWRKFSCLQKRALHEVVHYNGGISCTTFAGTVVYTG